MSTGVKRFVVLTALIAAACCSSGQVVDFNSNRDFQVDLDRLVRDQTGNPLVGTNYLAQLYYGRSVDSLQAVTAGPARFRAPTTSVPGTWAGGNRTLQGFTASEFATLQVRVWDSAVGASWEEAQSSGFGVTQHGVSAPFIFQIAPAGCANPFCFLMENLRGFTLVPEPSAAALFGAGALALLVVRLRAR